ncbi:MAG: DUF402 domain-containing protein [Anaerolineaceae bacterium]|nr:DUF402 domain-containing protein [Anaerolineaceae bacterium]
MNEVVVIKLDVQRQERWRYSGQILEQEPGRVLLEAYFNRDDSDFHGMPFKRGDRFVEVYFSERWYNIFEIYDRDDGSLKGWYCNVTRPAEIEAREIRYVDLALDLLVFTDGRQLVLDEDEFAALNIDERERAQARRSLAELQSILQAGWSLEQGWQEWARAG